MTRTGSPRSRVRSASMDGLDETRGEQARVDEPREVGRVARALCGACRLPDQPPRPSRLIPATRSVSRCSTSWAICLSVSSHGPALLGPEDTVQGRPAGIVGHQNQGRCAYSPTPAPSSAHPVLVAAACARIIDDTVVNGPQSRRRRRRRLGCGPSPIVRGRSSSAFTRRNRVGHDDANLPDDSA
jgi:hypothetical protein